MMRFLTSWDETSATTAPNGVGKRRLAGAGAALVRVDIPAGTEAARHSHDHEQFVQVIAGTGELETAQGRGGFGPGSLFHFPAGTWHSARFDTDTVLVETNLPG